MIKIYGKNCIYEAIRKNAKLIEIYLSFEVEKKDKSFVELLKDKRIKHTFLDKENMSKRFGNHHQGYVAYREDYFLFDESHLFDLISSMSRILILDGIMDPHNLGAIIRSADAFGVDLIILPKNRSCSITEVVAHVSIGAIEHVNIMFVNSLLSTIEK